MVGAARIETDTGEGLRASQQRGSGVQGLARRSNAQNPPFDPGRRPLTRLERRIETSNKGAVAVDIPEPRCNRKGVVLARGPPLAREAPAPRRRMDFGHDRS